MHKRVSILVDTDSRLKWGVAMARAFRAAGYAVDFNIVPAANNPSPAQVREAGCAGEWRTLSAGQLLSGGAMFDNDVLLLGLAGVSLTRFIVNFHQAVEQIQANSRPILATGYWGVTGMKHAEGILWRQGCDVICINSHKEMRIFSEILESLGKPVDPLVVTGFPLAPYSGRPIDARADIRTVLFVAQSGIPATRLEKSYILDALIKYAIRYPERRLVIKPRCRPGEHATHRENFHFAELYADGAWRRPANLEFCYGAMENLLDEADLMLTISSAAAFEAWARGIPVALIGDFGIRDDLANPYFVGCGSFASLETFSEGTVPVVNPAWLADNGLSPSANPQAAIERIRTLLIGQETLGRPLPPARTYFNPIDSPALFEPALTRNRYSKRLWPMIRDLLKKPFRANRR